MRRVFRIIILFTGLILLGFAGLYIYGTTFPEDHEVSQSLQLPHISRATAFIRITDVEKSVRWRSDLTSIRMLDATNGNERWEEASKDGTVIMYQTVRKQIPSLFEMKIADDTLPFSGSWTMELSELESGGCEITVTERGKIPSPVLRALMHKFYGVDGTINMYLTLLEDSFKKKNG